jgi:hypothetical protein
MHCSRLDFRITRDVADIPTAFMAEWGDTGPVIALLGEYDALSGLNQQSGALVCTRPPTALVWPATAAAIICWALRRTLPLAAAAAPEKHRNEWARALLRLSSRGRRLRQDIHGSRRCVR